MQLLHMRNRQMFSLELRLEARALAAPPEALVQCTAGLWQMQPINDASQMFYRGLLNAGIAGLRSGLRILLGPADSADALVHEAECRGPLSALLPSADGCDVWLSYEQHWPPGNDATLPFLRDAHAPMLLARLLPLLQVPLATSPQEAGLELLLLHVRSTKWSHGCTNDQDRAVENIEAGHEENGEDYRDLGEFLHAEGPQSAAIKGSKWLLAAVEAPTTPINRAWLQTWAGKPYTHGAGLDPYVAASAVNIALKVHARRKKPFQRKL